MCRKAEHIYDIFIFHDYKQSLCRTVICLRFCYLNWTQVLFFLMIMKLKVISAFCFSVPPHSRLWCKWGKTSCSWVAKYSLRIMVVWEEGERGCSLSNIRPKSFQLRVFENHYCLLGSEFSLYEWMTLLFPLVSPCLCKLFIHHVLSSPWLYTVCFYSLIFMYFFSIQNSMMNTWYKHLHK